MFNVGLDGMAIIGARIYNSSTSTLLYSHDTTVYNIYYGPVSMPLSFILDPGQTYRIGYYCSGNNSDNSADMFHPSAFPYTESSGVLRINQAYELLQDGMPVNMNIFVPLIVLNYDTVSITGLPHLVPADPEVTLFPNPVNHSGQLHIYSGFSFVDADILNAFGQVMMRKEKMPSSLPIDVAGLSAGIYFVRIHADGKDFVLKFMKEM